MNEAIDMAQNRPLWRDRCLCFALRTPSSARQKRQRIRQDFVHQIMSVRQSLEWFVTRWTQIICERRRWLRTVDFALRIDQCSRKLARLARSLVLSKPPVAVRSANHARHNTIYNTITCPLPLPRPSPRPQSLPLCINCELNRSI